MEGTPQVEFTIETVKEYVTNNYPITLAFQAYLNRTKNDIDSIIDKSVTIRLVKGAYLGDTGDFQKIQQMFKNCYLELLKSDKTFSVGTHDPELIEWMKNKMENKKSFVEFGFLKGLADETKIELSKSGWRVAEYVPFGKNNKAYVTRRLSYLKNLQAIGREPIP